MRGPRYYQLKRVLWTLANCETIPDQHGISSKLRNRFGHFLYDKVELPYHSQGGQDAFLNEKIFFGKRNGTFAEVGANDGVTLSNTLFFEKELGWRGVCVEPNPPSFEKLIKNRPSATCVQACAGKSPGTSKFPISYDTVQSLHGKAADTAGEYVSLPVRTLNDILEEAKIFYMDYMSIDTEGGEMDTFCALDVKRFHVEIVGIEENEDSLKMDRAMKSLGYRFIGKVFIDRIYRRDPTHT